MIKVEKIENILKISFNYDADIVSKIKTITGRKYNSDTKSWELPLEAIKKLSDVFGVDDLEISDDIDLNYEKPKYDFEYELNTIVCKDLMKFAKWALEQLPNYFYKVAASSSGKYHPAYAQGEEGLVRHTQAAIRIANELFKCETIHQFDEQYQDVIRVALLLHDGVKHGLEGGSYTTSTHPIEVVKYLEDKYFEVDEDTLPGEVIDIMEDGLWDMIKGCIKSHMGQWNIDYKTKEEILPKPQSDMEKFVHMCDYLASRKLIEINFEVL